MKKITKLLFPIIVFSLFGCGETDVSNNRRVLVKGNIVDQNNIPVQDALVSVYTDSNFYSASEFLLGEGFSNNQGLFEITSLFGSNELFYVTISLDNDYAIYKYETNTENYIPNDLVFDLQTVELKQLSTFNYTITRTSGDDNSLSFSLTYINPFCNEIYEEGIIDQFQSSCYFETTRNNILNNNIPNIVEAQLKVPVDTTVEFTYSINNGEEVTEIFNINSTSFDFEFTY